MFPAYLRSNIHPQMGWQRPNSFQGSTPTDQAKGITSFLIGTRLLYFVRQKLNIEDFWQLS